MTGTMVYASGWTLDDIHWGSFGSHKGRAGTFWQRLKSAALVELNAPDYVTYLQRVFRNSDTNYSCQHRAMGSRGNPARTRSGTVAERADPSFDFKSAFARFRAGYTAPHFATDDPDSVRGSRRGEDDRPLRGRIGNILILQRIRDSADEPVLKEIAGRIAADEFRPLQAVPRNP